MTEWYETKQFIERATTLSMDALHVIAGVLLLVVLGLLFRRPLSDPRPWLAVLGLALLNEANDLWTEQWHSPGMQYGEVAKDVALTMLLPTVLLLTARHFPRLYQRPGDRAGED